MNGRNIRFTALKNYVWALLLLLQTVPADAQNSLRLIGEAVYANDSLNYTLYDSTRYKYSGMRTSNMKTGLHLYDTASHWVTPLALPSVRYARTYDTGNRVATHIVQQFVAGNWRNKQQFVYTYLPGGSLYDTVRTLQWDTTNLVWAQYRQYRYRYTATRLDSIYWMKPLGSSWVKEAVDAYQYTDGHLMLHTLDVWNDTLTQWDRWQKEMYHYDITGLADTYERHSIDIPTRMLVPDGKEVYAYVGTNLAGKWTYYWFTTSQSWQGINEYYYLYNSHNDLDQEHVNYWDLFAQMWGPLSKNYYYYDFSYNVTDIIEKRFDFPVYRDYARSSWLYNSAGLPTVKRKFRWSDAWAGWVAEKSNNSQVLYYYENYNGIQQLERGNNTMKIFPNPATTVVQVQVQWQQSLPISVYLSDIQGRLLRQWQSAATDKYSQVLQVPGIAAGQYILRATNGNEEMTKLLIIANQ